MKQDDQVAALADAVKALTELVDHLVKDRVPEPCKLDHYPYVYPPYPTYPTYPYTGPYWYSNAVSGTAASGLTPVIVSAISN